MGKLKERETREPSRCVTKETGGADKYKLRCSTSGKVAVEPGVQKSEGKVKSVSHDRAKE